MKLNGFIYNSADEAHQDRQRRQITALADGRSVKWFVEKGKATRDFNDREELQACVQHCKSDSSTFALASWQGFASRQWKALEFLEAVAEQGVAIEVADDPIISQGSIHVLSANAQVQRDRIVARAQAGLDRVRKKLEAGKPHVTRSGREINMLGTPDQKALIDAGNAAKQKKADEFALTVWPEICVLYERGVSQSDIARQLNGKKVLNQKGNAWTQNAVYRVIQRMKKMGQIND